ncbi:hypothetical protein [Salinispora sp. H7-4]|uniref:hypothetical protein n=1 Tax=Salinispora sp. H7-4 TaxID=2748321 RepID=UPI00281523AE|nr:hypothetical protein [Salinispora sp. H7-4]
MTRTPIVITAVAVAALGAGIAGTALYLNSEDTPTSSPSQAPAASAEPAADTVDPYEVYLDLAPSGEPTLSREDAQTRAYLGCGQPWAPGTVDAALAEAYAELCADLEDRTG